LNFALNFDSTSNSWSRSSIPSKWQAFVSSSKFCSWMFLSGRIW
jgi:hypothetical protein